MVTGSNDKVSPYILTLAFSAFIKHDPPTLPEKRRTYESYTILGSKHPSDGTLKRRA